MNGCVVVTQYRRRREAPFSDSNLPQSSNVKDKERIKIQWDCCKKLSDFYYQRCPLTVHKECRCRWTIHSCFIKGLPSNEDLSTPTFPAVKLFRDALNEFHNFQSCGQVIIGICRSDGLTTDVPRFRLLSVQCREMNQKLFIFESNTSYTEFSIRAMINTRPFRSAVMPALAGAPFKAHWCCPISLT